MNTNMTRFKWFKKRELCNGYQHDKVLSGFQKIKLLRLCALDKSSISIQRVTGLYGDMS